MSIFFF